MDLTADGEEPQIRGERYAANNIYLVRPRELGDFGVAKGVGIDLVADLARETQKG